MAWFFNSAGGLVFFEHWPSFFLTFARDISINKLSSISGVTQSTVNNIVSGRNNSTTVSTVKKICDGLEITVQDFFDDDLFKDLEQEIK